MSIDSGFFKKERKAGNDTYHIRKSERRSNNAYVFSDNNIPSRSTKVSEEQCEEATLKLEYYNNHFEELTKDATKEELRELSLEIARLQVVIAEYNAQQMRSRKFL